MQLNVVRSKDIQHLHVMAQHTMTYPRPHDNVDK